MVLGADVGNQFQYVVAYLHLRKDLPAGEDVFPFFLFRCLPLAHKSVGVGLVGYAPLDNLPAFFPRERAVHFHRQAETVQ